MRRAYSFLTVKSIDSERRVFEGIATTPEVDRQGDIVEPLGAKLRNPTPLLLYHDQERPVGEVRFGKPTKNGIPFTAEVFKTDEPGTVRDRLDEAWHSVKLGLLKAVSIGFNPIDEAMERIKTGWRFLEWEMLELSLVVVPANASATIHTVKSLDAPHLAATGMGDSATTQPAGVPARRVVKAQKPNQAMTIQEQIKSFEATRQAKSARMFAIMEEAGTETLEQDKAEEYDGLEAELKTIDEHLTRLASMEKLNKSQAQPVGGTTPVETKRVPAGVPVPRVSVKPNIEKGITAARMAMALLNTKGNRYEAAQFASERFADTPEVALALKAAVAAGTTTDSAWAGPLVVTQPMQELLEMLRPQTLIGRIPGLKRVPFNISMPAQTAGGTYSWVGQGSAKPVTNMQFSTVTLGTAKAAGIIVLTQELIRSSAPSAQEAVRDEMIAGMRTYLDTQFVDSTVAAVANVSPASITNGVAGTAASGTTEAAARADLRALINTYNTANYTLDGLVLIMSESVAFTLGTMVNAVGAPAFPGISVNGGNILGIPVVTSNVVGAQIIAAHAPSILVADDGQTEIDVSTEASIQMDSAPANPTDATTVLVSMFQRNLVALRAERWINWAKARSSAVQRITTVAYA
jgi:HK97 family phage major capsid protein/HK97 family phage prohead protease